MTIAGVEPVSYLHISNGNADEIYTREQVRDILIKLLVDMTIEDVDGLSTLKTIPDNSLVNGQSEKLVDEFMESGE